MSLCFIGGIARPLVAQDIEASSLIEAYGEYLEKVKNFEVDFEAYVGRYPHFPTTKASQTARRIRYANRDFELLFRGRYCFDSAGTRERMDYRKYSPSSQANDKNEWTPLILANDGEKVRTYDQNEKSGLIYSNQGGDFNHLYSVGTPGSALGKRAVFPPPQDLIDLLRRAKDATAEVTPEGNYMITCSADCFVNESLTISDITLTLLPKCGFAPESWRIGYRGIGTQRVVQNRLFEEVAEGFWLPSESLLDSYICKKTEQGMSEQLWSSLLFLNDLKTARIDQDFNNDYFTRIAPPEGRMYDRDTDSLIGGDNSSTFEDSEQKGSKPYSIRASRIFLISLVLITILLILYKRRLR
jgi:hypothetical protein